MELEPTATEVWCVLGDLEHGLGHEAAAHRAWRQGPFHPHCAESSGRAWLDEHPTWAAQRFEQLAVLTSQEPWTDLLLARAQARFDPAAARASLSRYLLREPQPHPELGPAAEAVLAVTPDPAAQLVVLTDAIRADPTLPGLTDRQLDLEVDLRAQELMGAAPTPLDASQQAILEHGRQRFGQGDLAGARSVLEGLANHAVRNPSVWAALADVRAAQGEFEGADLALGLARQLSPLSASLHARHAQLLADHYGGRFDEDALVAVERALEGGVTPALLEQHATLALRLHRTALARASLVQLGGLIGEEQVRERLAELDRERPVPLVIPALPTPEGVSESAWLDLHRGRVFLERARRPEGPDPRMLRRAHEVLARAVPEMPARVEALNTLAQVQLQEADESGALASYRRSLAIQPEQPEVLGSVALILRQRGDPEAEEMLERAAAAGSGEVLVDLAEADVRGWRWWRARGRLATYRRTNSSGAFHARARELQSQLDARFAVLGALAVIGVLGALGVPLLVRRQKRTGVGVRAFVDRHPRSVAEVARVLSAIRHEVLKHNVSAVPVVVDRLQSGDATAAAWLSGRLAGPGGAFERLDGYLDELRDLAQRAGTRLNLAYRDPLFAQLIEAFDTLRAVHGRTDARAVARLAEAGVTLNGPVYDGLGTLLKGVCAVEVGPALVREAWAIVRSERPSDPLVLEVAGPSLEVHARRTDVFDILTNLLRNAAQASVEEGRKRVGVRLALEEDPITGLQRAEVRVCDDVERRLTTAMIRGRFIDRGLGLAVDLVSRNGGAIHVESEPGWSKAVVVRLPLEGR